jgi:hypothetical protein
MQHPPATDDVREDPCRSQLYPSPPTSAAPAGVAGAGRAPANAASLSAEADVQSVSGRPDQAVVSLVAAGALR